MSASRPEGAPSQPLAPSAAISFLSLPTKIRKNIYKRVLAVSHPLYLFQDPGCPVETFAPEKPRRWLALLYTNRQISAEASEVLYGVNQFTLQDGTSCQGSLLRSFLNCIGPVNAGFLSHICMRFPVTERIGNGQSGEIGLREDALQTLQLLHSVCTQLETLETLIYGENSSALVQEDQIYTQVVRDVLLQIDAQFRAIASLNKIIVRLCSGHPAPPVRDFLQGLGWVVLVGGG